MLILLFTPVAFTLCSIALYFYQVDMPLISILCILSLTAFGLMMMQNEADGAFKKHLSYYVRGICTLIILAVFSIALPNLLPQSQSTKQTSSISCNSFHTCT